MDALPGFAAEWLRQRLGGAAAVAEVERGELAALTDAEALALAEVVLAVPSVCDPGRAATSGFVEQQRLFSTRR